MVLEKVKLNPKNYDTFVDILRESGDHFDDLIQLLAESQAQMIHPEIKHQGHTINSQQSAAVVNPVHFTLGMACGCGFCKCGLGCPSPLPAEVKFPLLDCRSVSELNNKERQDLQFKLQRDTKPIMLQFYRVVSGLYDHTIEVNVPIERLKFHLKATKAFPNGQCYRYRSDF